CDPGTGVCSNPAMADGTACSDGSACTQTDTCQAGMCVGGDPVTCTALDQCHDIGECDPASGECSNPASPDGTACEDGDKCTAGDSCQSGSCVAGSPVTCTPTDACHLAGTCNPGTGICSNPVAPNGTTCSDGDACTKTDTCQSGICVGSNPVVCLGPDQCHQLGACVPETGACSYPPKADGSACNDGDLCTQTDACQSGLCVGGNPVVCTGGNACQSAGVCDPPSGNCLRPGKANGTACDDGDPSTESDTCQMGVCIGIPTMPSPTVATPAGSLGFIYQGAGASQIGVASGTIDAKRAAGVRGEVLDVDGAPLPGVKVTIADHAEYGYATSGEDGLFTVVVNGGGAVVVRLAKAGYLRAERPVEVSWQGYAELDPVVLSAADPNATLVAPGQSNLQVAQGSPVSDGDGERQAVLAFPPGTTASMVLANGTRVALGSLRVRVTEVTVGANGPAAMPAPLPATTAYTYAVNYTVDEALTSGDRRVEFDKRIYHYSENFLGFPVGQNVPSAYYDETAHRWVPSTDGRIIKVLALAGGQASVDVDGAGNPADATVLATMKFTADELAMLAGRYAPGTTLWRVPITHFTTWDYNWPWCTDPGATSPDANMSTPPLPICLTNSRGCIIEHENQVVGERVAIPGSPFSLNYRSNRTPGYKAANEIFVKLLGATTPPTLSEVLVRTNVAGQSHEESLAPAANLGYRYLWDGKDAFGRPVNGVARPEVMVGFRYPLVYTPPPADVNLHIDQVSFGALSANPLVEAARGRMDVVSWQRLRPADVKVGTYDARGVGLGGWTIDVHHALDNLNNMWLGDGGRRAEALDGGNTIVSNPPWARFTPQDKLAVANDGTIYIGTRPSYYSGPSNAIYRVDPATKQVSLFFSLQSLPAPLGCDYMHVTAIDAGPDGNIYFSAFPACSGWACGTCQYEQLAPYIFKLSPAGALLGYWKVGDFTGWTSFTGIPTSLSVARDGTIHYLEARQPQGSSGHDPATCLRVMKLESNGTRTLLAGGDCATLVRSQDPGPAASATFAAITHVWWDGAYAYSPAYLADLAVGRDGSLFVANYSESAVRKISPDGWITTFAGSTPPSGNVTHAGDGGPATQAVIAPTAIAVDLGDNLYIADYAYSYFW
ncbi:MAG: hypothetical protein JXP73_14065, partial [Deltaproteobacteria bacterium]|nr:hypothetical protein [Deltaproteobacteria bacterium]